MNWKKLLLVLFVSLLGLLIWFMQPPKWPQATALPSISTDFKKECSVVRDTWDTPHIKATTKEAAMYCWGYTQALDRGWQMDFLRRVAYGRAAEAYGSRMLLPDFFLQILSFHRVVKRWMKTFPVEQPKQYRLMQFYVWGVNQGFYTLRTRVTRHYLWKESYKPPPWRIEDTMMILMLQSFNQTRRSFTQDIKHARLRLHLGETRYFELYGKDNKLKPHDHLIIKPGEHPLVPKVATQKVAPTKADPKKVEPKKAAPTKRTMRTIPVRRRAVMMRAFASIDTMLGSALDTRGLGSNSWVLSAKRSQSGHAMLANDPHLAIMTPSFWHEVHITAPGLDVLGIAVPGTTAIVSGNNRHAAWGITNGYSNAADITAVTVNKGSIQLAGKQLKVESFRPTVWTKVGCFYLPIFWKSFSRTAYGSILPIPWVEGKKILFQSASFHVKKNPIGPVLDLMTVHDAKEADKALSLLHLPNWNLVFADTKGNIGYRQVGLVPRRKAGVFGFIDPTDPQQQWNGFLTAKESAALLNPKRGFIATANNRTFPENFPFFLGHAFVEGYRAKRIEQLIQQTPKHSLPSMQKIQLDVEVAASKLLLPTIWKLLHQVHSKLSPKAKQAVILLQNWNLKADRKLVAPTIFRVWFNLLEPALFQQDSQAKKGLPFKVKVRPGYYTVLRVLQGKIKPGSAMKVADIVRVTLENTLKKLSKELGPKQSDWVWGKYHRMYFFHQLGRHRKERPASQAVSGDEQTVNLSQSRGKGPYQAKIGPSYRLVVELSPQRIKSYGVLAGKQLDRQPTVLGSQQKLWLNGKYRPRPFYPDEVAKHKKSKETIKW